MIDFDSIKEPKPFKAYKLIETKANSNSFIQGVSGLFGFPYTLIADGAVIFTHYGPMINQIRATFGRTALIEAQFLPIVTSIDKEILYDLLLDKFLGNIPFAGIYFNAICAKTMTWRLGILFSVLSSHGEEVDVSDIIHVVELTRTLFPQRDMFRFARPDFKQFLHIVESAGGDDIHTTHTI